MAPARSLELFLSPVQVLLTESLFDTRLDPGIGRRRAAAPTIFINGVRTVGFSSPEALWEALRLAASEVRGAK
jgi:hypothetical protein